MDHDERKRHSDEMAALILAAGGEIPVLAEHIERGKGLTVIKSSEPGKPTVYRTIQPLNSRSADLATDAKSIEVEKRPGWDWEIDCIVFDEPSTVLVFGAMTIEEALEEARDDLTACELMGIEPDYEILGIKRLPIDRFGAVGEDGQSGGEQR